MFADSVSNKIRTYFLYDLSKLTVAHKAVWDTAVVKTLIFFIE